MLFLTPFFIFHNFKKKLLVSKKGSKICKAYPWADQKENELFERPFPTFCLQMIFQNNYFKTTASQWNQNFLGADLSC